MIAKLTRWRWSLRRTLLLALLPGMLVIGSVELLVRYRTIVDAANSAYDRSLLGAIKAIDANISTESGGVAVEMPYRMLEFFQLTASGNVYFRVATEDGLADVGNANLPLPAAPLSTQRPHFYDAVYFGEKIRIGAYARSLNTPLSRNGTLQQRIVIQVGESLDSRNAFIHAVMLQTAARDAFLLLAAAILLVLVLNWALRPLARLRDEIGSRSPLDLAPIDAGSVPVDVRPLVEAINQHILRHQRISAERRRFTDDASHQLRTPLTTLRTQLDYILRERDTAQIGVALSALSRQLDDAIRGTNQMLALARIDATEPVMQALDLVSLAGQVMRGMVPQARDKQIDLGFEAEEDALIVWAHAGLLQEAISNLVHNAVRFAPCHGHVTLRLQRGRDSGKDETMLTVMDNGPGVPPEQLSRLGERFFRASNAASGGAGLGLAIAFSVVQHHGGQIHVSNQAVGTGCIVTVRLPLAPGQTA